MGSTANQVWEAISSQSAALAEQAGKAIVAVDAGHRVAASGVHWKPGVIVTASHLVRRADEVRVILPDGSRVKGTVAGRDSRTDLAAVRIESLEFSRPCRSPPAQRSVSWFLPSRVRAVANSPLAPESLPVSEDNGLRGVEVRSTASFAPMSAFILANLAARWSTVGVNCWASTARSSHANR